MPPERPVVAKSAQRALDVLELLAALDRPARSAEIADLLGIARSSTDQLLKTLVASGYLVVSPLDHRYEPSLRLARVAHWIAARVPASEPLSQLVQDIHQATGEVATITVLNDCTMQILLTAGEDRKGIMEVGKRVPLLGTASGQAALTTRSRADINRLVRRARRSAPAQPTAEPLSVVLEQVSQTRLRGHAARTTLRSIFTDTWTAPPEYWASVAVSLRYADTDVVLSVSGPQERVAPREWRLADLMRDRATRLVG